MPRYLVTLFASTDTTLRRSAVQTFDNDAAAQDWAASMLDIRRKSHPRRGAWDRWAVLTWPSDGSLPHTVGTGRAAG